MFKKEKDLEESEIKSILSNDLKVEGNIKSEGKIRIDGEVIGNVSGDYVILGNGSKVKGNLNGGRFIVMGNIEGNVSCEILELKSSANVKGDINAKQLSVEAGSGISGRVNCGSFSNGKGEVKLKIAKKPDSSLSS